MALLKTSGVCVMGVGPREIDLAGDEEEHGAHDFESGVAACLAFGGLEQTIERLDESVGLSGSVPETPWFCFKSQLKPERMPTQTRTRPPGNPHQ
jgi:hypothetical protein